MNFRSRIHKLISRFDLDWLLESSMGRELLLLAICFLAVMVFGTLVMAVLIFSVTLISPSLLPEKFNGLSLLPAISISAGVLIAILAFARENKKLDEDRERNSSKVFLERAIVGFDIVVKYLSDQNNDRVTWVHAARTLLRVLELGSQIKNPEYQIAFKLEAEQARAKLYEALSDTDLSTGGRKPLPGQFFYGLLAWGEKISLDEAAIKASPKMQAYNISIDSIPPQLPCSPLSEKSVIAIYNFLEYPKNYSDPLNSVEDWGSNWESTMGIDQGARRYIAHRKKKYTSNGKLYDREVQEDDS